MSSAKFQKSFFIFYFFLNASFLFAQSSAKIKSSVWEKLPEAPKEVQVSYKYSNCSFPAQGIEQEVVYMQFKNLTNKTIKFQWKQELWYGDKCYNCDGSNAEMNYTITLKPAEILEGTCEENVPGYLKIFSKNLDSSVYGERATPAGLKDLKVKNTVVEIL